MHLRKQKTTETNVIISLDDEFTTQGNNNTDKCRYIDTIPSDVSLEEDYSKKEIISIIKEAIQELPDKEKEVIKLYFGFYDKMYNQIEIASIIGLTQSYISRIIRKTMEMIRVKLIKKDIIDYKDTAKKKKRKNFLKKITKGGLHMKRRDFLININNLPEVLSKEETNKLIKEIKNNNKEAKQKLIEHNIKLVIFEVLNKFKDVDEDKEELVSIGIIGLIKAVETFNSEKNILFSTYASRCIDNEILMHIRKQKHLPQIESIDNVISVNNGTDGDDTNKLQLINSLDNNNTSIEDKLMKEVTYEILNEIIEELPDEEKVRIKLYFGFYDKRYKQKEIAEMFNTTETLISRKIKATVKKIRTELIKREVINYKDTNKKRIKQKNYHK